MEEVAKALRMNPREFWEWRLADAQDEFDVTVVTVEQAARNLERWENVRGCRARTHQPRDPSLAIRQWRQGDLVRIATTDVDPHRRADEPRRLAVRDLRGDAEPQPSERMKASARSRYHHVRRGSMVRLDDQRVREVDRREQIVAREHGPDVDLGRRLPWHPDDEIAPENAGPTAHVPDRHDVARGDRVDRLGRRRRETQLCCVASAWSRP